MKKLLYAVYLFAFLLLFIFFLSVSIKSNTFATSTQTKVIFTSISAQGWGFFTRSPREPMVDIYKIDHGVLSKISSKNSTLSNILGFSRKSRKIGMEISTVLMKTKKEKWNVVDAPSSFKIPESISKIDFTDLYFLTPGDYLLVKKTMIPWAWYGKKNNFIPYETLRVQIR